MKTLTLLAIAAFGMAFGQNIWHSVNTADQTERFDVPAIQEPTREPFNCSSNALSGSVPNGWYQWGKTSDGISICEPKRPMVTTCADKERILEHSESGKYWCRKVQN